MGFKAAEIKDLHLPLMYPNPPPPTLEIRSLIPRLSRALIDYRGYRLIAVSSVPISRDTLVYGSRDGGQRVVNKDPNAQSLMEKFGEYMLLKAHKVGKEDAQSMIGPADIEVHRGFDNRYYVVDFARVFPPEEPRLAGEHLIHQFRPEFVRKNPKPLNSDAFSSMNADQTEASESEAAIREATDHLHSNIVPEFVRDFEKYLGSGGASSFRSAATSTANIKKEQVFSDHILSMAQSSLITEMHRAGISSSFEVLWFSPLVR